MAYGCQKVGRCSSFCSYCGFTLSKSPDLRLTSNDKIFDECEMGFDEWEFWVMGIWPLFAQWRHATSFIKANLSCLDQISKLVGYFGSNVFINVRYSAFKPSFEGKTLFGFLLLWMERKWNSNILWLIKTFKKNILKLLLNLFGDI